MGEDHLTVPGYGPKNALGMIVGEAPGHKEVEAGRPFVGASGRLLDTALSALGVRRDECYVTNVVKEMPLNSEGMIRRPYPEEIKAWSLVLTREMAEIAPKAILCLGRVAVDAVMGEEAPFGTNDGHFFAAWHPSYLLHGGGDREEWLDGHLRPWAEALGRFEYP